MDALRKGLERGRPELPGLREGKQMRTTNLLDGLRQLAFEIYVPHEEVIATLRDLSDDANDLLCASMLHLDDICNAAEEALERKLVLRVPMSTLVAVEATAAIVQNLTVNVDVRYDSASEALLIWGRDQIRGTDDAEDRAESKGS